MKQKNKTSRSKWFMILALSLCVCLLAACGSGGAPGSAAAGSGNTEAENAAGSAAGAETADAGSRELKDVTVLLDWTPNTNHTGIYAAKELGYYEEAGLNVNIQIPSEGTATQLVGVGKAEFGIGSTEDTINAITLDDPMPVISIAAIIQHNTSGFVSLKEAGIHSPADWEGKTYGGYGGTTEEKIVRQIAQANGVDPDSIRFVNLGNSDTLTSLQNEIDFIWVFEAAELIGLELQGVEYDYLPVRDYGEAFDYYTPVIIANSEAADNDPNMVKAFLAATAKGYQYAIEEPENAADLLLSAVPELNEDLIKKGQSYLAERYAKDAPQWGWQEASVWEKYADFLYQNELIGKEADVDAAFTTEYLP